jgi:hypothetical protein
MKSQMYRQGSGITMTLSMTKFSITTISLKTPSMATVSINSRAVQSLVFIAMLTVIMLRGVPWTRAQCYKTFLSVNYGFL